MFNKAVEDLLGQALEERQDLFLIDLSISSDNAIKVVIDGDNGVSVEDCVFVSRAIEHNLDRETEDFSLEVTSAGATAPMTNLRQYKKNIGRTLKVVSIDQTIEGTLANVTPEAIVLEWKAREPKPVGKGKVTVNKQATIAFSDIKEAKVMIKL
ncbi:MAG: ribosome assembly cofactor RimP [Flavobacteriaceae bacterium]|nr:ribosome assembly cofactor RimP [Mangrovimonas sp.]MCB0425906.1 ribosome assembly cofactor RimP [Mangrovimonas sp.]MCB0437565.1 ribosome assembly cofactor RimP [Mangrovimonas sp.]HPF96756.1 ribosome assembly cofactor RimP [Mangrovimonas sp.]HRV55173.1 ribosome assembly cofactor RimP [Mangrovimonas sp.]